MLKPTVALLCAMLAAGSFVVEPAQLLAKQGIATHNAANLNNGRIERRSERQHFDHHASCEVEPINCPQIGGIGWNRNLEPAGEGPFVYMRSRR